jgi:hypothetical protein
LFDCFIVWSLLQGIQICLYVQKDLWEWLLHLAKMAFGQSRDPVPPVKTALALPLFATAVLLGIPHGRKVCLDYLKNNWQSAIQDRDRSLEHVTETGMEALAKEVDPDFVELSVDLTDSIVEALYEFWVQDILRKQNFRRHFFPYGTAKEMFLCASCRKWLNPKLAAVIPCENNLVFRRNDGKVGYVHSKYEESCHILMALNQ